MSQAHDTPSAENGNSYTTAAGPPELDEQRMQAFGERAVDMLNSGFLSIMMSLGHQLGLFDVLATLPPSTSASIARAAGLHERYVREWLGAMVTGKIVEFDSSTDTYALPREHAVSVTRDAGPENLAGLAQFVSLLAGVEQPMLDVFRNGGGLGYDQFPRFHALMAESSRAVFEATLLSSTLELVPGLKDRLESGLDVADVGCGEGVAMRLMAERFPNSRLVGYDFSTDAIATARKEAAEKGLDNVRYEVRDVASLTGPPAFDLITAFDAIHDQASPRRVLRGIREALRPDGVFLMVDMAMSSHLEKNADKPFAPFLYTVSTLHCTTVSLAQGGEGLGACWGEEQARDLLAEAGFSRVDVERVEGDMLNAYYVCRP